jgi:DNA-binding LacI/PurR family transcriptional regulator
MEKGSEKLPLTAANKEFASLVTEIFDMVERRVARRDIGEKLFRRLKENWHRPTEKHLTRDRLAQELNADPVKISKEANIIRGTLAECCAGKSISITLSTTTFRLLGEIQPSQRARKYFLGMMAADLSDWIVGPILAAAERVLGEHGYRVIVKSADDDTLREEKCLEELATLTDGIIAVPAWDGDPHGAYARLAKSGFPVVLVDRSLQGLEGEIASVTSDNFDGGYQAANYLIDRYKCRRIHVIADYPLFSGRQRIEGFKKAIATAGVHGPIHNAEERQGRAATFQWAFRKTRELLTHEIIAQGDGIFALNDVLAAGCRSATDSSKFPVPVIGFDGQYWGAYLSPPLETIAQDMDEMVSRAVSLMLRLIDELDKPRADYIRVQLRTAQDRLVERTP